MRHLVALLFFVAAVVAYSYGGSPMFLGVPLVGSLFLAVGVVFEIAAWWHLTRPPSTRKAAQE